MTTQPIRIRTWITMHDTITPASIIKAQGIIAEAAIEAAGHRQSATSADDEQGQADCIIKAEQLEGDIADIRAKFDI